MSKHNKPSTRRRLTRPGQNREVKHGRIRILGDDFEDALERANVDNNIKERIQRNREKYSFIPKELYEQLYPIIEEYQDKPKSCYIIFEEIYVLVHLWMGDISPPVSFTMLYRRLPHDMKIVNGIKNLDICLQNPIIDLIYEYMEPPHVQLLGRWWHQLIPSSDPNACPTKESFVFQMRILNGRRGLWHSNHLWSSCQGRTSMRDDERLRYTTRRQIEHDFHICYKIFLSPNCTPIEDRFKFCKTMKTADVLSTEVKWLIDSQTMNRRWIFVNEFQHRYDLDTILTERIHSCHTFRQTADVLNSLSDVRSTSRLVPVASISSTKSWISNYSSKLDKSNNDPHDICHLSDEDDYQCFRFVKDTAISWHINQWCAMGTLK
jgi:hypothetical protein